MFKGKVKAKARVGKICYINCLPFYHRLRFADEVDAELYETYPSKLNLALRLGKIDLGPVSSLEYLNHQKDYLILPDLAIGSRDFSGSVLLLSNEKIEGLNGSSIALTRKSLSSAALLRILLKFKYKFKNKFISSLDTPDAMLAKHKAVLVIGDEALNYQPQTFIYKYDLSELWWNWTGKPFCFALWAVRRSFAKENPELVEHLHQALTKNADRNLTDIETLVKDAMGMSFLDTKFSKIFGYLFNLTFKLDPTMLEGLELFYRLSKRLGISPEFKGFEFFRNA